MQAASVKRHRSLVNFVFVLLPQLSYTVCFSTSSSRDSTVLESYASHNCPDDLAWGDNHFYEHSIGCFAQIPLYTLWIINIAFRIIDKRDEHFAIWMGRTIAAYINDKLIADLFRFQT